MHMRHTPANMTREARYDDVAGEVAAESALLGGSPKTMEILVSLFASSPYLAGHLVGHPELLDSLVRADAATPVEPTADGLREALDAPR